MAQTDQLVDTLKHTLKAHGKTYRDVATALKLSEASVKRLFSDKHLSLHRLDSICQMLDIEISDLVQTMNAQSHTLSQLNQQQETDIAADHLLLLVTVSVLNRWTPQDILSQYRINEHELTRCLAHLDRLKIIDLLPNNHIKLRIAANFTWLTNGPIQQFFLRLVSDEFFQSRFDKKSEKLIVINGMLSSNGNAVFQRRLEKLVREFDELNNEDMVLPLSEREGTTVVLAMRQWHYKLFENLRR